MPETPRSTTHTFPSSRSPYLTSGGGEETGAPVDLRGRLLRIALLPLAAAVMLGAGTAAFLTQAPTNGPSWTVPTVLVSATVLVVLVAFFAVSAATKTDTDLGRRVHGVRRSTVETHYKVWQVLDDLQRDLPADQRWSVPLPNPADGAASA
ncbi:MAG TPA: hypothetical protein VHI31_00005, partial [Actinomycetota bacterium]|nr:hypothetical protein [Actinomycetota bacterium]